MSNKLIPALCFSMPLFIRRSFDHALTNTLIFCQVLRLYGMLCEAVRHTIKIRLLVRVAFPQFVLLTISSESRKRAGGKR